MFDQIHRIKSLVKGHFRVRETIEEIQVMLTGRSIIELSMDRQSEHRDC